MYQTLRVNLWSLRHRQAVRSMLRERGDKNSEDFWDVQEDDWKWLSKRLSVLLYRGAAANGIIPTCYCTATSRSPLLVIRHQGIMIGINWEYSFPVSKGSPLLIHVVAVANTMVYNGSMNSKIKCENRVVLCRSRCKRAASEFGHFHAGCILACRSRVWSHRECVFHFLRVSLPLPFPLDVCFKVWKNALEWSRAGCMGKSFGT